MQVTGVICEYNPLHMGHKKQLDLIKARGSAAVCLMSGNFVQRGAPAIFDKTLRAKAAVLCGADLVLELPVTASLSSAEGFAAEGVRILSAFCDTLCFGAETADKKSLLNTAKALLSEGFSTLLRAQLDKGLSFPAARQAALEDIGLDSSLISQPNNILAVEYCKAILSQDSPIEPFPIHRPGSYRDTVANRNDPSATALRGLIEGAEPWLDYIPLEAHDCFKQAAVYTLAAGERAVLARLRCMTESEFEALPHGSEGLWRKLMHAVRKESTLADILAAVKSKRYTMTRLNRMVMCAYLGITQKELDTPAPYVRVLAFNDRGREILKTAKSHGVFPNIGEVQEHPYQVLENRCGDLYGLFVADSPEPAGTERQRRVSYLP